MQASVGSMLHNKTGTWRFIKPVYEDKVPACQNACPAGNDIEGWIKLLEKGEFEKAYWHLKQEEPFPAVLGRVCFKFCESSCNRVQMDEGISIKELERFVGDQVPAGTPHPLVPDVGPNRLAVVGSGPAGMSVAYFARLLGFKVTIFEKSHCFGGLLARGIPEYRLPTSILKAEFEGLANMGIELKCGVEVGVDISFKTLERDYDYVFLASGVHKSIDIPLEGSTGTSRILSGLQMLKAVADAKAMDLGRDVVVVGGGNTAIDAARTALRKGCDVTVLYRRSAAEMPAHEEEVQEAKEEGVTFKFLAAPEKIVTGQDGALEGVICREMELGPADESGRRKPVPKENARFNIKADTLVTAIGEAPDFEYLKGNVAPKGTVIDVNGELEVQAPGTASVKLFAGGDIIDTAHTVIHAVATGKLAAIAMDCDHKNRPFEKILKEIQIGAGPGVSFSRYMGWPAVNPGPADNQKVVDSQKMVYDYFETAPKVDQELSPPDIRKKSFAPYRETFSKAFAQKEAQRCMHCGRCTECDQCMVFCPDVSILDRTKKDFGYAFDYDFCKGCGICATECPRNAITMIPQTSSQSENLEKEA